MLISAISNSRIQISVKNIDEEIGKYEQTTRKQHTGLHHRIVPGLNTVHNESTHTRIVKNGLGNHGSVEYNDKINGSESNDRYKSIFECMPHYNQVFRQSFDPRHFDFGLVFFGLEAR
jgi:hypothetical protein